MTKIIRTHLSMMYDELWADHYKQSTGITIKPFKDRHKFGDFSLNKGFSIQKPQYFKNFDITFSDRNMYNTLIVFKLILNLIVWADNRMKMGDFRYGPIIRQNLDNYDVAQEFDRRLKEAIKTKNLEYIVDAYNMLRIEGYKLSKNSNPERLITLEKNTKRLECQIKVASAHNWKLTSIDDGIHAKEK